MRISRAWALALGAAVWLVAAQGAAQASLISGLGGAAGFGPNVLPANDDGSSSSISLASAFPVGLRFFSATHSSVFVNNNGNITFSGPVGAFTPVPFPVAAQPMIAPYWGDVDTRAALSGGQNLVYWDVSPGRFIATWYNVGYFSAHTDRLNAFQVILTDQSASGAAGDFDVEFRYNRCEWTTGDASGGSGGLGGTPAQAGFDAGDGVNFVEMPGSRTAAILTLCVTSNVAEPGVWRFQIRSGAVTACGNGVLEAGEACDDGNTTSGDGCSERCDVELPNGDPCSDDSECRSGFCTDGVCCDVRCGGQCEACALATSAGICTAVSGAPVGGRPACTGAGATCGGTCDGSLRASCAYPSTATSCDDGAFCTVSDACNGAGACAAGAARSCDDGVSCTADVCDEVADVCTSTLAGGCFIDGACVADGTPNPLDSCEVCDSASATSSWSAASAGTSCDDGLFCTVTDVCDGAGACGGAARDCSDGIDCTLDVCDEDADTCGSLLVDTCQIDGSCVPVTTLNPANPCEVCDPARDETGWSSAAAGASCDDGLFCTESDACDGAGGCAGSARTCDDGLTCTDDVCDEDAGACDNDLSGGCLVGGACVAEGQASPADACLVCDPSASTSDYTPSDDPDCAGVDAGVPVDAGTRDAGTQDGGVEVDAGRGHISGGGCGCRVGDRGTPGALAWLGLLALALTVLRRRR